MPIRGLPIGSLEDTQAVSPGFKLIGAYQVSWEFNPLEPAIVTLLDVCECHPGYDEGVHDLAHWFKPRVEFRNNWDVVVDDVMPTDLRGILKHGDPINYGSMVSVKDVESVGVGVVYYYAVNLAYLCQKTISLTVKD